MDKKKPEVRHVFKKGSKGSFENLSLEMSYVEVKEKSCFVLFRTLLKILLRKFYTYYQIKVLSQISNTDPKKLDKKNQDVLHVFKKWLKRQIEILLFLNELSRIMLCYFQYFVEDSFE